MFDDPANWTPAECERAMAGCDEGSSGECPFCGEPLCSDGECRDCGAAPCPHDCKGGMTRATDVPLANGPACGECAELLIAGLA